MVKCEFCDRELINTSALNHHKKTAKYCLKIQNKNNTEFSCDFCLNIFATKNSLQNHLNNCKEKNNFANKKIEEENTELKNKNQELKNNMEKLKLTIEEQKIYISKLETKVEIYEKDHETISDIAKQTKITNTTNNIINNLAVYDIDKITEQFTNKLEYITKEDIINGQKGIANIIAPCLQDENGNKMLTCTDRSRLIFTKLDENKNRIKDIELKNLASVIKPIAIKKADEIVTEHNKNKQKASEIYALKIQNNDYKGYIKQFSKLLEDAEIANVNKKLIKEYRKKITEYEDKIDENEEKILDYEEENTFIEDEEENDKLIDGHTEIKYLDSESTKFARHVSKLI